MKKIRFLSYLIVVLTLISASIGLFYSTDGHPYVVENIYGQSIELYGDGIYKYDSVLKAGANKGADLVMGLVAIAFAVSTAMRKKTEKIKFLRLGLLAGLLYYASCLAFGVTFNRLFPIYVLLFSSTLFTMIFLLSHLIKIDNLPMNLTNRHLKGTGIFIILGGSSVLVWLEFIIPALVNGQPLANIEVYTTEPTFVLDLAIIFPTYLACGIGLLKKKKFAYKLAPILLSFLAIVGLTVISQSVFQYSMGIIVPINQMIGLVISFIILGLVASILNIRFLNNLHR